ncbi:hypothetical protein [Halorhodospira halophila]|uniref:hypothetical protein n=1 Tax=Halorhodospira halophila TaxID=1053 RepID=UPI001913C0E7|nr:hypothetical protein [Halorhodospira halophila]
MRIISECDSSPECPARQPGVCVGEPTSGLDGANLTLIVRNLQRLADSGACVIVISHDLELIERVCTFRLTLPAR